MAHTYVTMVHRNSIIIHISRIMMLQIRKTSGTEGVNVQALSGQKIVSSLLLYIYSEKCEEFLKLSLFFFFFFFFFFFLYVKYKTCSLK